MDIYTALVLLIGAAVLLYICHLFLGVCRCSESPPLLPQHRDQGGARADHYHRSNYVTAALPTTRPSGYGVHQTSPRPNQLPNEQVHTAWRPSAQANLRAAEFAAAAERQKVKAEEWRVAEARRVAEAQRVAEVHRVAEAQRVFWYQEESARARRRESEEQERADGLLLWKAEQVKREAELVRLAKEDTRRRKEAKGKEVSRKGEEERLKKARLDGFRQQGEIDALEARVATAEDPDQLPKSTQVKPPRTRPARKVKSTSPKALASKQPPFYHRVGLSHLSHARTLILGPNSRRTLFIKVTHTISTSGGVQMTPGMLWHSRSMLPLPRANKENAVWQCTTALRERSGGMKWSS